MVRSPGGRLAHHRPRAGSQSVRASQALNHRKVPHVERHDASIDRDRRRGDEVVGRIDACVGARVLARELACQVSHPTIDIHPGRGSRTARPWRLPRLAGCRQRPRFGLGSQPRPDLQSSNSSVQQGRARWSPRRWSIRMVVSTRTVIRLWQRAQSPRFARRRLASGARYAFARRIPRPSPRDRPTARRSPQARAEFVQHRRLSSHTAPRWPRE